MIIKKFDPSIISSQKNTKVIVYIDGTYFRLFSTSPSSDIDYCIFTSYIENGSLKDYFKDKTEEAENLFEDSIKKMSVAEVNIKNFKREVNFHQMKDGFNKFSGIFKNIYNETTKEIISTENNNDEIIVLSEANYKSTKTLFGVDSKLSYNWISNNMAFSKTSKQTDVIFFSYSFIPIMKFVSVGKNYISHTKDFKIEKLGIFEIAKEFNRFLGETYKASTTNYRILHFLKNTDLIEMKNQEVDFKINNVYSLLIEVDKLLESLALFIKSVMKDIKISIDFEKLSNPFVYIFSTFFHENTTKLLIEMIMNNNKFIEDLKKKNTKKRKRNETEEIKSNKKIKLFESPKIKVKEFITIKTYGEQYKIENKIINYFVGNIGKTFEETINIIENNTQSFYDIINYIYHLEKENIKIFPNALLLFITLKTKDITLLAIEDIKKLNNTYRHMIKDETIRNMLSKNMIEIYSSYKENEIIKLIKNLTKNRLLMFLKYEMYYLLGNYFDETMKFISNDIKKGFEIVKKNWDKFIETLTGQDIYYYISIAKTF